jgi:hypothetical protein
VNTKDCKGFTKTSENLRDHMTDLELKKIKHGLDQFIPFACPKGFTTAGKKG